MYKNLCKWLIFIFAALFITACSNEPKLISLSGSTMGTTYHIKLVPNDNLPSAPLLQAKIDLALDKVNNQMSTYRENSELSKFNQLSSAESIQVSPDTAKVINEGIKLYHITNGALDITLGPLVNLWGFGPDKRPATIPSQEQIDEAKSRTGMDGFTEKNTQLTKLNPDLYIDLSSIAKGFGVDKVSEILNSYRVSGYMVEIGGEVRTFGSKENGALWRIAVEQPTTDERAVQQVIEPTTMAMATSGDYRNYYEEDGQRFSHLIDPRTGFPINHKLASVTVLNKSCMVADGYATAMMVLGVEDSLALAKKENLAIMLIAKEKDGFKVYYSEPFKKYLVDDGNVKTASINKKEQ